MKSRTLVIAGCLAVCGLSIAGAVLQARQINGLREEGERLQQQLRDLQDEQTARASSSAIAEPALGSPSSELLRLRNQVSQLMRRERELAGLQVENERLRIQAASARTNAAKPLLPGYIRKSEARNLGYTTPEATLETMLWAIRVRDFTNLLAAFTSEIAGKMQREMERSGRTLEEFFRDAEALPGMRPVDRTMPDDDTIELKVEIVPGSGAEVQPMRFRRVNGEWKMDSR